MMVNLHAQRPLFVVPGTTSMAPEGTADRRSTRSHWLDQDRSSIEPLYTVEHAPLEWRRFAHRLSTHCRRLTARAVANQELAMNEQHLTHISKVLSYYLR